MFGLAAIVVEIHGEPFCNWIAEQVVDCRRKVVRKDLDDRDNFI